MTLTINSRDHGKVEFYCYNSGEGYIYITFDDGEPSQICSGGGFRGSTIYSHGEKHFHSACKNWWSAYLRSVRS